MLSVGPVTADGIASASLAAESATMAAPAVRWSTYVGGTNTEDSPDSSGNIIVRDAAGNAYVTGWTWSNDFQGAVNAAHGAQDAFVAKLSPAGAVIWARYLGGSGNDSGSGICLDRSGNLFVTGSTASTDFERAGNSNHGQSDAFLAKLSSDGALQWVTYLAAPQPGDDQALESDYGYGVAADSAGNALVTGYTNPGWSALYGFVTKVTTDGRTVWTCTVDDCKPTSIAVDSAGNALITGNTTSNAMAANFHGSWDAFVVKVTASGSRAWSTCLGGTDWDFGSSIRVDAAGNAFVSGMTVSNDFAGAIGMASTGYNYDAFVAKVSSSGTQAFANCFGGAGDDRAYGIALNDTGSPYLVGCTTSTDFPGAGSPPASSNCFVIKANADGSQAWATYVGGRSVDYGYGIAAGTGDNLTIIGSTYSDDLPAKTNSFHGSAYYEAFVAQFGSSVSQPAVTIGDGRVAEGSTGTAILSLPLTLSAASSQTISVNWATQDQSAVAPADYVAASGQVTFYPGETSKTISVQVKGDTLVEGDERFLVNLTGASNATIADGQGVATIVDDDSRAADLVGAKCDVPTTVKWGQQFAVKFKVANQGEVAVPANSFRQGFYLSKDPYLNPAEDPLLGTLSYSKSLKPGTTGAQVSGKLWQLTLAQASALGFNGSGPFYVLMATDVYGQVAETNESNNSPSGRVGADCDSFKAKGTKAAVAGLVSMDDTSDQDDLQVGAGQCEASYDPATSVFRLRNAADDSQPELAVGFGVPDAGWKPLVGDWDGDGQVGIGLYDPAQSVFYLTDTLQTGCAEYTFAFGVPGGGWEPIVGDWDGDGQADVGLYDPKTSTFYLTDARTDGSAQSTFAYGQAAAGWKPLVGDWDGDGKAGVALYDAAAANLYLKDSPNTGYADRTVPVTNPASRVQFDLLAAVAQELTAPGISADTVDPLAGLTANALDRQQALDLCFEQF